MSNVKVFVDACCRFVRYVPDKPLSDSSSLYGINGKRKTRRIIHSPDRKNNKTRAFAEHISVKAKLVQILQSPYPEFGFGSIPDSGCIADKFQI